MSGTTLVLYLAICTYGRKVASVSVQTNEQANSGALTILKKGSKRDREDR